MSGKPGAPCAATTDCASLICDAGTFTCFPSWNDALCVTDLDCISTSCKTVDSAEVCVPLELGNECLISMQCPTGAYCDTATATPPFVCTATLPDGNACTYNDECTSSYCDTGGTGQCAPKPNGEFCNSGTECSSTYCVNTVCVGGIGDTCSVAAECQSNVCESGVCAV
jgi:hypothetical protein